LLDQSTGADHRYLPKPCLIPQAFRQASDSRKDPHLTHLGIGSVIHDHREVEQLFDKLQATTEVAERSELFGKVKEELERHATADERVLYPRVKKEVTGAKDEAKDATEEHDCATRQRRPDAIRGVVVLCPHTSLGQDR
jgi:hemerythrin superfamily protein